MLYYTFPFLNTGIIIIQVIAILKTTRPNMLNWTAIKNCPKENSKHWDIHSAAFYMARFDKYGP